MPSCAPWKWFSKGDGAALKSSTVLTNNEDNATLVENIVGPRGKSEKSFPGRSGPRHNPRSTSKPPHAERGLQKLYGGDDAVIEYVVGFTLAVIF